ncbi:sugar ABC transporter permease [Rhizobiaceae bacterium]|nr:sugar ABC transporter permease [Rhizobiaceae bacterium]
MATTQTQSIARMMLAPSVIALLIWMIIPLAMTLYFSTLRYSLYNPETPFIGLENYVYFISDPSFWSSIVNTLLLVGGVLVVSIGGGIGVALLLDQAFHGQGIVRLLAIAPFFIMPTVSALVWKNMFMNPVSGLFAFAFQAVGLQPVDWLSAYPLASIIAIVGWEWMPFATLILLTSLQSLSGEQKEAAEMDGASAWSRFVYIILPHMARAITIVILIETIFLLGIYAEIFVTTAGGPGTASTTLTYLVAKQSLTSFDAGATSAGGIIAVVLANIVAIALIRVVGKNIEA